MKALKSLEGITLPKEVNFLYLDGVKEIKDVVFPEKMKELSMNSLKSLEGVTLPKEIDRLDLGSFKDSEKDSIKKSIR